MLQLNRDAFRDRIHDAWSIGKRWQLFPFAAHVRQPDACSFDIPILHLLALSSRPTNTKQHDLLVLHGFRMAETVCFLVLELHSKKLVAYLQACPGNNQNQHSSRLDPPVDVFQKQGYPAMAQRYAVPQ